MGIASLIILTMDIIFVWLRPWKYEIIIQIWQENRNALYRDFRLLNSFFLWSFPLKENMIVFTNLNEDSGTGYDRPNFRWLPPVWDLVSSLHGASCRYRCNAQESRLQRSKRVNNIIFNFFTTFERLGIVKGNTCSLHGCRFRRENAETRTRLHSAVRGRELQNALPSGTKWECKSSRKVLFRF